MKKCLHEHIFFKVVHAGPSGVSVCHDCNKIKNSWCYICGCSYVYHDGEPYGRHYKKCRKNLRKLIINGNEIIVDDIENYVNAEFYSLVPEFNQSSRIFAIYEGDIFQPYVFEKNPNFSDEIVRKVISNLLTLKDIYNNARILDQYKKSEFLRRKHNTDELFSKTWINKYIDDGIQVAIEEIKNELANSI